jgi:hypothetical protein
VEVLVFKRVATGSRVAIVRSMAAADRRRPTKRIDVFRIQRSGNGMTVIALIGRMEKEHIVELETVLNGESPGRRIVLDLKNLTLAGQREIDFLTACELRGVTLANCAPYIREWITNQRSENGNDV